MGSSSDRFLSADDILGADDLDIQEVEVPEWAKNGNPGILRLRVISADEAIRFQEQLNVPHQKKAAWVKLLALCAVDAEGNRLFSDKDMELLKKKSTAVFLRLQKKLLQMNGFGKEAVEEAKND